MKKMMRREFISTTTKVIAVASLSGVIVTISSCSSASSNSSSPHPNILLIMVGQMQTPPKGYGTDVGMAQGLKEILGFRSI